MNDYRSKKLFIFDLDGTLALSKSPIDDEMSTLLRKLLDTKKVLVLSGGAWQQLQTQLVSHLTASADELANLTIATGSGSAMYRFENSTPLAIYQELISEPLKKKVFEAFEYATTHSEYLPPEETFGGILEDRGTEITFSALGQDAPLSLKETWDPDHTKRTEIIKQLLEKIPELEIRIGGTTSIDVTKKGIDKAFGIQKASEILGISTDGMVYIGDALFPGGNDEPVRKTGVECVEVRTVEDTKTFIRSLVE
ncbi:MAG: HAD-IIB family hydrolase [Patescibacteria group bacterium]